MSFNGLDGSLPQYPHVWKPESLDQNTYVWKNDKLFVVYRSAAGFWFIKQPGIPQPYGFSSSIVGLAHYLTLHGFTPEPTHE